MKDYTPRKQRTKQQGGKGMRVKRHGMAFVIPALDETTVKQIPFPEAEDRIARHPESTRSCTVCGAAAPAEYCWTFVMLEGQYFCGEHAPAAQEKALVMLQYGGSWATFRNLLGRMLPRELRITEHLMKDRKVNVIESAVGLIADALVDTVAEARDALVIGVQLAISKATWDSLPDIDHGITDPKLAASVRLQEWLLEVIDGQ